MTEREHHPGDGCADDEASNGFAIVWILGACLVAIVLICAVLYWRS